MSRRDPPERGVTGTDSDPNSDDGTDPNSGSETPTGRAEMPGAPGGREGSDAGVADVGKSADPAEGAAPETVRLDSRPSRTGTAVAGLAGLVAVTPQVVGGPAAVVGGLGLVALVAGLRRGVRRLVSLGVLGLILGVLVAGAVGVPAELLLVSAAAGAVAWDVADQAVSLGEQVGRGADTARAELVHAAGSALVATAAVAAAYLVFRVVTGGPVVALALLLLGAILLASVLRG